MNAKMTKKQVHDIRGKLAIILLNAEIIELKAAKNTETKGKKEIANIKQAVKEVNSFLDEDFIE